MTPTQRFKPWRTSALSSSQIIHGECHVSKEKPVLVPNGCLIFLRNILVKGSGFLNNILLNESRARSQRTPCALSGGHSKYQHTKIHHQVVRSPLQSSKIPSIVCCSAFFRLNVHWLAGAWLVSVITRMSHTQTIIEGPMVAKRRHHAPSYIGLGVSLVASTDSGKCK